MRWALKKYPISMPISLYFFPNSSTAYKPIRAERHITFTFAITFTSSFTSLSASQPNASTSVNRDVNVNTNVNANMGVNDLRKQA